MTTVRLGLRIPADLQEIAIADLADLDFASFEQEGDSLEAFIPARHWDDVKREEVAALLGRLGSAFVLEEEVIPEQNWNARWEASIRPIRVGRFVLTPPWAEADAVTEGSEVLVIEPKMSFGTGSHESTRLALSFLPGLVRDGASVLDAGTGTGILGIAALRIGAGRAFGFDVDPWSIANASENAARNGVEDRFEIREGGIEVVPTDRFDLILANIDRATLTTMLAPLVERVAPEGVVLLSGLLRSDRDAMVNLAGTYGFGLTAESYEGDWWCGVFERGADR